MKKLIFFTTFLLSVFLLYSQKVKISGIISDANSREPLLFAVCVEKRTNTTVYADNKGFYSLTVPKGDVELVFYYSGYKTIEKKLTIENNLQLDVELEPLQVEINEIKVQGYNTTIEQVVLGKNTMSSTMLKSIPSLAGEADLMRALTFLPGVSGGRETSSNIYVRGGDKGQNLILIDGIKVYNTNHFGGFLSIINSNIVRYVDVYKGGFPARFGGRASSVIDIYTKEGNSKKFSGKVDLGIINSSVLFEGPLAKNLSGYLAIRNSNIFILNFLMSNELNSSLFNMNDLNSKITYKPTPYDILSLSVYFNTDLFKINDNIDKERFPDQWYERSSKIDISTSGGSLSYTKILGQKLTLNNILSYTYYQNSYTFRNYEKNFYQIIDQKTKTYTGINDLSFQSRLSYVATNKLTLRTGVEASYYIFNPGIYLETLQKDVEQTNIDTAIGFREPVKSNEINYFAETELNILKNVYLNTGVRATLYNLKDTTFPSIEPRVSLRTVLNKNFSLKASYTIMSQYNHLMMQNTYGLEREIWLAATKDLPPQKAVQYAAGLFFISNRKDIDISVEGFYKLMTNLVDYKSPIEQEKLVFRSEYITAKNGLGLAYGIEFLMNVNKEKYFSSLSYTLSWNKRKFDELNNGEWFYFIYDRRHSLSFLNSFRISPKLRVSTNFVFSTGTPVTLPIGFSKTDDFSYEYFIYGSINNRRLPVYHRLDIALTYKLNSKKGFKKYLNLNIYNAYARQNAVALLYDSNTGKIKKIAFFSIVPSVSYSIEF